jgi:GT2 family glycosyltransferase
MAPARYDHPAGHPHRPMDRVTDDGLETLEVIIVAYGAPDLLEHSLAALEGAFPVIVVDNSSDSRVEAIARKHGAVYVDPKRNLGFAAGVNVGVAARTRTGDVLLLNPDATVTPEGVATLSATLHERSDLAAVAPVQSDPASGASARVAWPFPSPSGAWVEAVGLGRLRRAHDFLIGAVLLLRSEALVDVGRFDEQFFLYAEEIDWQRRARHRGWHVRLCTEVVATHVGAGTGGDRRDREVHFHASHERYIRKHFGRRGWWVYRSAAMIGALPRSVLLPGQRGRDAAYRFHLYRTGPCRAEQRLGDEGRNR